MAPPPVPKLAKPNVSLIPTQSAALAAQQSYLDQQIKGLPGLYNPQRQRAAAEASRGLTDAGYFERANPTMTGTSADGSQTWGTGAKFEGSAFRNQRRGQEAGVASRGIRSSTATDNQMQQATKDLVNASQRQQRAYDESQFQSLQQQGQQRRELGGQQSQVAGQQADYGSQAQLQRAEMTRDWQNQQQQLDYQGALTQDQYDRENAANREAAARWEAQMAEDRRRFDLTQAQEADRWAQSRATQNLPS